MQTENENQDETDRTPRHARTGSVPVTIDLTATEEPKSDADAADTGPDPADDRTEAAPSASDADKPGDPAQPAAAQVAAEPAGRGRPVLAGLAGGLLVAAGMFGLNAAGIWPGNSGDPALEARIGAQIESLTTRLASAESQVTALSSATPAQDLAGRIEALEKALAATPVSTSSDPARLAALTDEVAGLKSALDAAIADEAKARAALEMRLEATEKKVSEPRDDVDVARAIASAGLKAAIDRGGPFLAELDTLARIVPDDPAVAELKTFAATGVPSRADLMTGFPDVANAILAALATTDPDQGFLDRLSASAWSLVKVRPVGNVEGEGPDAIVARIESKLQNGDLKGAVLEFDTLPDAGKAAAAAFKAGLDARLRVEELVGGTLDRALPGADQAG